MTVILVMFSLYLSALLGIVLGFETQFKILFEWQYARIFI